MRFYQQTMTLKHISSTKSSLLSSKEIYFPFSCLTLIIGFDILNSTYPKQIYDPLSKHTLNEWHHYLSVTQVETFTSSNTSFFILPICNYNQVWSILPSKQNYNFAYNSSILNESCHSHGQNWAFTIAS